MELGRKLETYGEEEIYYYKLGPTLNDGVSQGICIKRNLTLESNVINQVYWAGFG